MSREIIYSAVAFGEECFYKFDSGNPHKVGFYYNHVLNIWCESKYTYSEFTQSAIFMMYKVISGPTKKKIKRNI